MEGDTGDGREAPVQKKGKEFYANTDREIDQHELAELLRKSADIVERGEFGSVLYEALQDFRADAGWVASADIKYAFQNEGDRLSADTITASSPVVAVVFGQAGLIAGASIEGAKYTRVIP